MGKRKATSEAEIAWQHRDIMSKYFGESLRGRSLSVYGIRDSLIKDVRPTNLPAIEANELRLDNLFLMEDDSYAIVDYESRYSEENKVKYLGYIARVSQRLYNEYGCYKKLRLIVIYTADVNPEKTVSKLDLGAFTMQIEEAFLTGIDSEKTKEELTDKLDRNVPLTDEDIMKLVLYPLTYKGKKNQQKAVSAAIDIAERIDDEDSLRRAESGIYVFSDKIIAKRDADRIHGRLNMTKIGRLLEEDYQKREKKAVDIATKEARKEAKKEAKKEMENVVIKLLKTGDPADKVAFCTGFSIEEVETLAARI